MFAVVDLAANEISGQTVTDRMPFFGRFAPLATRLGEAYRAVGGEMKLRLRWTENTRKAA